MKKAFKKSILMIVILSIMLIPINAIFRRKSHSPLFENESRIGTLYRLPENTIDVLAVGSSHTYTSINPIKMYDTNGLKTFVMSSQQQSIPMSYYHIREVLRYQNPKVVILNTYMFNKGANLPDSVLRDAIEFLRPSTNKIRMIRDLVPKEDRSSFFIPLIAYHSRWDELDWNDIRYALINPISDSLGFVPLDTAKANQPINYIKQDDNISDKIIVEEDLEYFKKIKELCENNNIELLLYEAPYPMDEKSLTVSNALYELSENYNTRYLNLNTELDHLEIDFQTDYFDNSHLNKLGAEKVSQYLANYLVDEYSHCNFNLESSNFFDERKKAYDAKYTNELKKGF